MLWLVMAQAELVLKFVAFDKKFLFHPGEADACDEGANRGAFA